MIQSLGILENTRSAFSESDGCVHFEYAHHAAYLSQPAVIQLHVLLLCSAQDHSVVITDQDITDRLGDWEVSSQQDLTEIAEQLGTKPIQLNEPLPLEPVFIPKPWGQEIWYSGIEARGVCTSNGVSIAWLIDLFGHRLGVQAAPMLLKILDPFPDEELGNLYFEMHQEKIEVYVVTNVDRSAWPDGIGQIRYGFNQMLMQNYETTDAFLDDYVDCVNRYREIREEIDGQIKTIKRDAGLSENDIVSPDKLQELLKQIDPALTKLEETRRKEMYDYTQLKSIAPGDVITVQPLVPHSLQYGVRVIEFQTPHYERFILSFGQEVVTQSHWDTEQVRGKANTGDVQFDEPMKLEEGRDLIADFSAFRVERLILQAGESRQVPADRYNMMMGVTGEVALSCGSIEQTIKPEQAFLNPAGVHTEIRNAGNESATILVAEEVD